MNKFYVDSCIYLNLWNKEGSSKFGKPYWQIAQEFFDKFNHKNSIFYYSGFIIKELKFKMAPNDFQSRIKLFDKKKFRSIFVPTNLLPIARKIESETYFAISFYDILHLLLAKKSNSILVTRDKKLLEAAKKYSAKFGRPEDFL